MKKIIAFYLLSLSLTTLASENYARYKVKITNQTKSQNWGLPLIVSHTPAVTLFQVGQPASDELQALAKEGDNEGFATLLKEQKESFDVIVGTEPIGPGETKTFELETNNKFSLISVLGMLSTTNDTFAALAYIKRPMKSIVHFAETYDAGAEQNTENCEDIPGPPCGSTYSGPDEEDDPFVHLSNGILGVGDLKPSVFGWTNPALKIEITKINAK